MLIPLMYSNFREANNPQNALQRLAEDSGEHFFEILRELFDNLSHGVIVSDDTGQIVVFNRAAEEILGYSAEEVVGRHTLWDFCEECNRPPLFRDSLRNGRSFPAEEVEMMGKDPKAGILGVKVTPLYGSSKTLVGALAVIRNLQENRVREREKKSAERMSAIGRIVSVIAHEINNPLQSIRTILELSQDTKKTPTQRQKYLQEADAEIARIVQIITHMRNFYRPTPVARTTTDVNAAVLNTLATMEGQLAEAEVQVEARLAPKLSPVSIVDYQLEQIVLHLAINILGHTPKGAKLAFITSRAPGGVIISMQNNDTRYDLRSKSLEEIAEMLETSKEGFSLGLSVSQEILEEAGGRIEVENNEGLRLNLYLPA